MAVAGAAPTRYGALLDALRGVTWPARVASRGATAGTHRSKLRGSSAEFTEYRAYRQGDDPRRLDWKLLGRTDRAYLRITNERATLSTMLVVDASASMGFARKWETARALAVGLGSVAHAAGDPVGLLVSGSEPRRLALTTRRHVISELARTLDDATPSGSPDLAHAIRPLRPCGRLAVISDLLSDAPGLLRGLGERLARGADVVVVHVIARAELDPPGGSRLAEDPEVPSVRRPLTGLTRPAYLESFAAWRASTAQAWRGAGARYVEVVDDEAVDQAVRRAVAGWPDGQMAGRSR